MATDSNSRRCVLTLTCDKCMQFLSARNRLEVPTLITTVMPDTWPVRA